MNSENQPLHVVILAAGEGKRMKSAQAKVLLPLAGRPLLAHVLATARAPPGEDPRRRRHRLFRPQRVVMSARGMLPGAAWRG